MAAGWLAAAPAIGLAVAALAPAPVRAADASDELT
jgi:hypothetical protein